MTQAQALNLLKQNVTNQNLIKHSLAVEAVMRALALHFSQDVEKWGLAGLLHDIDYERTKGEPAQHSLVGAEMLENFGLEKDICQTVKVHNEAHQIPQQTLMEKALFVTDPLTGLIVAGVLVLPSKKLADLSVENLLNRFKEKAFARGADRQIIQKCTEYLNLTLAGFIKLSLVAMQGISHNLSL